MKKLLTIMLLCGVCHGYAQNAPPYAASTQTWTFGNKTWSDALRHPIAGCEAANTLSITNPPPAQYKNANNGYGYYYNWTCVEQQAAKLCPSPWRMPTPSDFATLYDANYNALVNAWELPGYAFGGNMYEIGTIVYYWSSAQYNGKEAYSLNVYSVTLGILNATKNFGFQVRCVREKTENDINFDEYQPITEQFDEYQPITEQFDEYQPIKDYEQKVFPIDSVDQNPEFPGGKEAMMKWVNNELKYPVTAMEMGIGGRVVLSFVVGKDGVIREIAVLRGVAPSLDKEAIRVVSKMPKWRPGFHEGKPVFVKYMMPLIFQMRQR